MIDVVRFYNTGSPDVLQIEQLEIGNPGPGEISVQIEAIGLNRAEIMFRRGAHLENPHFPARLGYEGSAIVEALGEGVTEFEVGEPVCIIPSFSMNDYGIYAEKAIVPAHSVIKRPKGMDAITAASIWMSFLTSWGALINQSQLCPEQNVLITAASSSAGLAAIQVVKLCGATPIAVTRTEAKAKALYNAGASHVIVRETQDVVEETLRLTNNQGADIIFDPIAGGGIATLAEAARSGGIIYLYGNLSGKEPPFPLMQTLAKGLTFRGYTLFEYTTDPHLRQPAIDYITHGFDNGDFKNIVDKVFTLDEIVEAHTYMESNQQIGKIVVTVAPAQ